MDSKQYKIGLMAQQYKSWEGCNSNGTPFGYFIQEMWQKPAVVLNIHNYHDNMNLEKIQNG